LVEKLLQTLILRGDRGELVTEVGYAVVIVSLVSVPHILTLVASEDYCRAIALMFENISVCMDLFAPAIPIAALKFYFG
jgi:hypothetical protein